MSRRTQITLLSALLVWSFALRAWNGTVGLNAGRFWDERYGLENIDHLFVTHSLRPANGFHPSLSYYPQAILLWGTNAIHRATGIQSLAIYDNGHFSPAAYLVCRWSQAVMGTISIWLLFVIGRRLFGPGTGLLAALLMAAVPWHIRQSTIYKPDILLVLTTLIAFWYSFRAIEKPSLKSYLAAGLTIGFALASKFNAGPIALPITVLTLVEMRRDWRRLGWLAAAGATSAITFLALDPYTVLAPQIYVRSFSRTLQDYAQKGATRAGGSHWNQIANLTGSMITRDYMGRLSGLTGFLGLIWLGWLGWRDRLRTPKARGALMILTYVIGYTIIYTLTTANPSEHNWLTLLPFLALAGAALLVAIWRALAGRWRILAQPATLAVIVGALVLYEAVPADAFVYDIAVPTTTMLAGSEIRNFGDPYSGRLIVSEPSIPFASRRRGRHLVGVLRTEDLFRLPKRVLDRSDMEVFLTRRLSGTKRSDYQARLRRTRKQWVHEYSPAWFRARGPAVTVAYHPWRPVGEPRYLEISRGAEKIPTYRFSTGAPSQPGAVASIELEVRGTGDATSGATLRRNDKVVPMILRQMVSRKKLFVGSRVEASENLEITLPELAPARAPESVVVRIDWWVDRLPDRETKSGDADSPSAD